MDLKEIKTNPWISGNFSCSLFGQIYAACKNHSNKDI